MDNSNAFSQRYGYLSEKETPHLYMIAEILFDLKIAMEKQNVTLSEISTALQNIAGDGGSLSK